MRTVVSTYNPNTGEFGALTDPTLSRLFNQMVEMAGTGISPLALGIGKGKSMGAPMPAAPAPTAPLTEATAVA
jgi:hypothetical protein